MDKYNSSGTMNNGVFTSYSAEPETPKSPFADLTPAVQKALEAAGIKTVAEAQSLGKEKLIALEGVGEASADKILAL